MLVANAKQLRHLDRAVAHVHVGNPQSAKVGAVLDALAPSTHEFDSGSHYLLAAASHLRDEGLLDEDYDLANKLGIVIGNAAMVLRRISGVGLAEAPDEGALVRGFYEGAEPDARTRALLMDALDVMRAAMGELRDDDVLIVLAR